MRSKKLALLASTILCAICMIFGIVACGGGSAADAVKMYILPQAETLVSEDFTLPKQIGENNSVSVNWKSSNTNAIAIEDGGTQYNAKVTLQETITEVTLTISSGNASKGFIVRVGKLDVYTFIERYAFPQKNAAVTSDFDLDTSTTVQGKTATIAWEIVEGEEFAHLDSNGTKVILSDVEDLKAVKIKATFTYGEESASMNYTFNVAPALDHLQNVNRMYSEEGYPLTLSGYIVHVLEASASYGNATFYMIDDDFCSGYYAYRVKINADDVDKYVAGAHVTISGDTAKNYNGLWENNGGGTATVDDEEPINPREKVYAFDTDLLSGAPSAIWHESTYVSLSGWKIDSMETIPETIDQNTNTNVFTLKRGDVTIPVRLSKYVARSAEQGAEFVTLLNTLKVGDFVDVVGLLGNYNGYQIQPVNASDITKATAEGTNTDGAAVKAAVAKVNDEVEKNFSSIITSDKDVEMPTSEQGVTISYRVAGKAENATVTIDGGKISVKPIDSEKNYDIEVTYTIGSYKAYGFFKVRNYKASAADLLALAKANVEKITLSEVKTATTVTIPDADLLGAEISWTIENAPTWASISGNTVTISALPAEATTLTLKATLTMGTETTTATLTLAVAAAPTVGFKAIEAPAAGDYIFALYQGDASLDKWLYANGAISSNDSGDYGATTDNSAEAATFTLAASGEGWTIQLKAVVGSEKDNVGKYLELNDNHRWTYVETTTSVWKWNAEAKVLTFDVGGSTYYLGTYGTYNTISASTIDRITGDNLNSPIQYIARFGTMSGSSTQPSGEKGTESNPYTVAEILDLAKDLTDGSYYQVNGANAKIYVKGYVTDVGYIFQTYGLSTVKIADEKGGTTQLKLYTINWGDAMPKPETIPKDSPLTVGDYVVCYGFVKNFKGEIEVDKDGSNYPTFTTWTKVSGGDPTPGPGGEEEPDPTPSDADATISFTTTDARQSQTKDEQVWTENGVTFTNAKANSTNDVADFSNPVRCYPASTIKVEFTSNIAKLVFHSAANDTTSTSASKQYFDSLKASLEACEGVTVTVDAENATITVVLTTPATSFEFAATRQVRFYSIDVYASEGGEPAPGPGGEEQPEPPVEHVHNYTYTYDAENGWQHKGHCDVEGCDEPEIIVECTPENNQCPDCEHTFTEEEILDKLFALKADSTMKGTYSLTGKVLRIDTEYNSQFGNVTFTMKVGDKEVQAFREKSDHSSTVKAGDTVTVQGTLKHYYTGVKEFDANCVITSLTEGELTNAEKVSEALRAVTLPASTTEDITLPTSTIDGVTFEWASDTETSIKVEDGKLKVTQTAEQVSVKITLTATCGTDATATKEFTVIVDAKLAEGSQSAEMKYSGSTTGNMTADNNATTVGLDESIFTITSEKTNSGTNHVGLNKNGTMRLYKNETATLHIEIAATYKIVSIKVTLDAKSPKKISDLKVVVGTDTITGTGTNDEGTVASYAIDGTKVSLSSAGSDQIHIASIEIVYTTVSATVSAPAQVALLPGKQF